MKAKEQKTGITMKRFFGATTLVVVGLIASVAFAQQPLGEIAYTVGSLDYSQVRLLKSDGSDQPLSPQIQVQAAGVTVTASVASLGMPVWSRDRHLIAANALLSTTSADEFNNLLMNGVSTPSKILVVFDPKTGQGNAVFDMKTHGPLSPYVIDTAFSPDGNRLLYAYLQTNSIQYGIINRDGSGNVPLFATNLTEEALGMGIDWSPRTDQLGNHGNLVVVSYPLPDNSCLGVPRTAAGLVLVNLGPTLTGQILTQPQQPCDWQFNSIHDRSPVFSPDGTQLAFVRSVQDSNAIITGSAVMVINTSGKYGSERVLKFLPGVDIMHLSWSPDGNRVMFDLTQVGFAGLTNPLGIWTVTLNGSGLLSRVSVLGWQAFAPAWGPAQ